jgi:hypothetical protein
VPIENDGATLKAGTPERFLATRFDERHPSFSRTGAGWHTISETLAAVLLKEPDLNGLPANTPAAIRRLLRRCLDKDPHERLRDIGEARIAIGGPAEEMPAAIAPRHALLPWAIAGTLALATLAAVVVAWRATRPIDRPLMWLSVDLGPEARASRDFTAAISPDGSRLVFPVGEFGASKLAERILGQPNATPLAGTEGGVEPCAERRVTATVAYNNAVCL